MDSKERLKFLLLHVTPERGRFSYLAQIGGGSIDSWKGFWAGRQRPTIDMLEAVAQRWPEFAFWLVTGITDQRNGHRAPPMVDTYPEQETMIRARAEDYFRCLLRMKEHDQAGQSQSLSDLMERRRLLALRDAEYDSLRQSEMVTPEQEVAVEQKLEKLATNQNTEDRALFIRILYELQSRKQLSDDEFAKLLGITLVELAALRAGKFTLSTQHRCNLVQRWGFLVLHDILCSAYFPS